MVKSDIIMEIMISCSNAYPFPYFNCLCVPKHLNVNIRKRGPYKSFLKIKLHTVPIEPHTCPFSVEIHDDYDTLCNCCEECEYQCAMDI